MRYAGAISAAAAIRLARRLCAAHRCGRLSCRDADVVRVAKIRLAGALGAAREPNRFHDVSRAVASLRARGDTELRRVARGTLACRRTTTYVVRRRGTEEHGHGARSRSVAVNRRVGVKMPLNCLPQPD